jgi:uncharacterized protein DUF6153
MPTATTTQPRGATSGLLVPVLFVVLAGVLGMHGWGSHGVAGTGHTPSAHHSGVAADLQHSAVTVAGVVGEGTFADTPPAGSPHSAGMHLTDLCVAVLSGLGLVLLLLRSPRRLAPVFMPALRPSHSRRPPVRDRDPPSLARLSVLRR